MISKAKNFKAMGRIVAYQYHFIIVMFKKILLMNLRHF